METIKKIISFLGHANTDEIIGKIKELCQKIPADEEIKKDLQQLLVSVKSSISFLESYFREILPRLETLKKYFEESHRIISKPELTTEDTKKLNAIIEEVCKHIAKILNYNVEQQKFRNHATKLQELKLEIAKETKFHWYHNSNLMALLIGVIGGGGFAAGAGAACYVVEMGCLGAAGCMTLAGAGITGGIGLVALGLFGIVAYFVSRHLRRKKEKENIKLDSIDDDLDALNKLLEDYSMHLQTIGAEQSNFDCGMDNLNACLKEEFLRSINKECCQELIKTLDEQIQSIRKLLEFQNSLVSEFFQNH